MNKLSFWHKLAFLCNICWLATMGMKYGILTGYGGATPAVLVIGLLFAHLVNVLVNIFTGFLFTRNRLHNQAPQWLFLINFLFLLAQVYFLLHDSLHY